MAGNNQGYEKIFRDAGQLSYYLGRRAGTSEAGSILVSYMKAGANEWTTVKHALDEVYEDMPTLPSSSVDGGIALFSGTTGKDIVDSGVLISTDGAMEDNSDTNIPTEAAIVTYVGNHSQPAIQNGNGVNYYVNSASEISGYLGLSPTPDEATEVDQYATSVNGSKVLIHSFATDADGIGGTLIGGGVWTFYTWSRANSVSGSVSSSGYSSIIFDVYVRSAIGVESLLFSVQTGAIPTSLSRNLITSVQPAYAIDPTDRLVVKVYGKNTSVFDYDIHLVYGGTERYSYLVTPVVAGVGGSGDVSGPASAVDGHVATFDGVTGKMIEDSGVSITSLALDTAVVHTTSDETVAGVKSFTSNIKTIAPVVDLDVATKKYVDDNAGGDTLTSEGALIASATAKVTLVDADQFAIMDSVSGLLKRCSWSNLKAQLKAYFDAIYCPIALTVAMLWANRTLNAQWLLEETFEKLLQGTLSTGNATPASVTRVFGNAATDNNGIATWSGTWTSTTGFRYTSTIPDYFEATIRTDGTSNIVLDRSATGTAPRVACPVLLDGASHGTWDQTTQTYTMSAIAAGVHTIRVTCGGSGTTMRIASLQYYQLPNQRVEVPGDVVQILFRPEWLMPVTSGVGNTSNGATHNTAMMGESVLHKLPLGTAVVDGSFARDSVAPAGWTLGGSTGIIQVPIMGDIPGSFARTKIRPGISLTVSSSDGTRGKLFTASEDASTYGPSMGSAIYRNVILPMIGIVTTAGSGSALGVGEIVLIVTANSGATASAVTLSSMLTSTNTGMAMSIYKIP